MAHPLEPFYRVDAYAAATGKSVDQVRGMLRERELLGIPMTDSAVLLPAAQFDGQLRPLPHLSLVLAALDPGEDHPVAAALWLTSPEPRWDDRTPVDLLRSGEVDEVIRLARVAAAEAR